MADLVVRNANVWTVDPGRPRADAIAVQGDRIVAVGTSAGMSAWIGRQTRVVDAGGRFLMPGFNDAHIHLMTGGTHLDNVNLRDAESPNELARRIAEQARTTADGEWITGGDWDEQRWASPQLPTRELIDPATPATPVLVNRYDEHMALANSVTLRLAGITAETPDPPGGVIVRDPEGEPTGILKDAAMARAYAVMPRPGPARRERALRRAMEHMASLGVTSVQDMGTDEQDIAVYAALAVRGELTTRIRAVSPALRLARELGAAQSSTRGAAGAGRGLAGQVSSHLTVSGAKTFADGSLGSSTAFFFEPYADAPASHGLLSDEMQPIDGMRQRLSAIDKAGEQVCVHAIGDRAVALVLDLLADIERANGQRDRRPRIEHSQHLRASDFARYAALGAIASVQPSHAIDDGKWAEKRVGPERAKTTYAFRSFLVHGVPLAFGTDWPVAALDPLTTLYAAVTRATEDGNHPDGWVPAQKLGVAEAIHAATLGSAYAEFCEKEKGSLAVGKLADFVILSEDPFAVPPASLRNVKVTMTVVGGQVVYEK